MSKDILRDLRGFGTVEKWVLTDPNISISAKGLYALLCAFAGDKGNAFPGTNLLRHQLNVSKDTIHKYIKELREKGVIQVEQERKKGQFSRNVYTLLPYRVSTTVSQKTGHGKTGDDKTDSDNLDTNNNSSKSNSNKKNSNKDSLSSGDDAPSVENKIEKGEIDAIAQKWNEVAPNKIRDIKPGSTRDKALKARITDFSFDELNEALEQVRNSDFLQGKNDRGWSITFDWFVKASNFQKIIEGNYANRAYADTGRKNSTQISQDFGGVGIRMGRGARQVFQNQDEGEQQ